MNINCPNCGHTLATTDALVGAATPAQPAAPVSVAPSASQPHSCAHGPRTFREGTNKSGKDYKGYFCAEDQCSPEWVSTR